MTSHHAVQPATAQLQSHKHLSPACKSVSDTVSIQQAQNKINTVKLRHNSLVIVSPADDAGKMCLCDILFAFVKFVYFWNKGPEFGKNQSESLFFVWHVTKRSARTWKWNLKSGFCWLDTFIDRFIFFLLIKQMSCKVYVLFYSLSNKEILVLR